MYSWREPLYPFGYGLSYTTFAYSNLRTSAASLDAKGALDVSVDVKNTGDRAGDEVVQLYVKHIESAVDGRQGIPRVQAGAPWRPEKPRRSRSRFRPAGWPTGMRQARSLGCRERQGATDGRRLVRGHQVEPDHRNHAVKLRACGGGDDAEEKGAVGRDDGEPGFVGEIGGRDVAEFRSGAGGKGLPELHAVGLAGQGLEIQ